MPDVPERVIPAGLNPLRAELLRDISKKWVNGTVLHYYFFDSAADGQFLTNPDGTRTWYPWSSTQDQKNVVRQAFQTWKDLGIGLSFEEVKSREAAEIRIGFMSVDGSWSYIGRDIIDLDLGSNQRTMNFGWDLTRAQGIDTAIHEIGHTLGFPHEHQNPYSGIVWDEEAVYRALAAPPNKWDRAKTLFNIIRKLDPSSVEGSTWDPDSVMHYPFGPGLIKEPIKYQHGLRPAGGLSARDKRMVKAFYPLLHDADYTALNVAESVKLAIAPRGQRNFVINPNATRTYTIRTFGNADTVMVLFENDQGNLRYLAGADDSGEDINATLTLKLHSYRTYVLRVRLYYADHTGETAVMFW
jgi:hypothetical protein